MNATDPSRPMTSRAKPVMGRWSSDSVLECIVGNSPSQLRGIVVQI
ncbi:hypothetical protein RBSWK_04941 [Rhodopirellula baltica SWK14]|uniref:Uncharacterized protein n=1 Tax=Rhodopirellula baltica SWK14 TaxID=993516 RepID=L7CB00_RHOBT|nr:hypothetical protein RBSWK_04941 [Rhodopirellula baltica SWK14]